MSIEFAIVQATAEPLPADLTEADLTDTILANPVFDGVAIVEQQEV